MTTTQYHKATPFHLLITNTQTTLLLFNGQSIDGNNLFNTFIIAETPKPPPFSETYTTAVDKHTTPTQNFVYNEEN